MTNPEQFKSTWRKRLHEIIFEADTPAGKLFDVVLLWAIILSVVVVMIESMDTFGAKYKSELRIIEWVFTILFTIEYFARIISVSSPRKYILSFFGIIDLLAVIPTYLSLILVSSQYLVVIRSIRLLRVFRVLKLARYLSEASVLTTALKASRHKITVFLGGVFTLVLIFGTLVFIIEGPEHGFTSIPKSMYWAIVTLTTVGYGDITPQTPLGQAVSAIIMIMGYGIIAVPTGIVSVEISKATAEEMTTRCCTNCSQEGHSMDAEFCKYCGSGL